MKNGPYELVITPKGYPGKKYRDRYAYEHTVVWWIHNGKIPSNDQEIHHINGNHRDNRIENLTLLSSVHHKKIHCEQKTKTAMASAVCGHCRRIFNLLKSRLKTRQKNSKSGSVFCSRRCQHKSLVGGTRVGSRELAVNQLR